jgi:hypothetical protein
MRLSLAAQYMRWQQSKRFISIVAVDKHLLYRLLLAASHVSTGVGAAACNKCNMILLLLLLRLWHEASAAYGMIITLYSTKTLYKTLLCLDAQLCYTNNTLLRCCPAAAADGVGDPNDPAYAKAMQNKPHPYGATHTGGSPIEFGGGPGQRQVSDAVAGGPIKGGSKTTFTTMG